jgi:hypothetical protein
MIMENKVMLFEEFSYLNENSKNIKDFAKILQDSPYAENVSIKGNVIDLELNGHDATIKVSNKSYTVELDAEEETWDLPNNVDDFNIDMSDWFMEIDLNENDNNSVHYEVGGVIFENKKIADEFYNKFYSKSLRIISNNAFRWSSTNSLIQNSATPSMIKESYKFYSSGFGEDTKIDIEKVIGNDLDTIAKNYNMEIIALGNDLDHKKELNFKCKMYNVIAEIIPGRITSDNIVARFFEKSLAVGCMNFILKHGLFFTHEKQNVSDVKIEVDDTFSTFYYSDLRELAINGGFIKEIERIKERFEISMSEGSKEKFLEEYQNVKFNNIRKPTYEKYLNIVGSSDEFDIVSFANEKFGGEQSFNIFMFDNAQKYNEIVGWSNNYTYKPKESFFINIKCKSGYVLPVWLLPNSSGLKVDINFHPYTLNSLPENAKNLAEKLSFSSQSSSIRLLLTKLKKLTTIL